MINFIDTKIYNFIFKLQSVPATVGMKFFSFLGSAIVLITVTFIILLLAKNKMMATRIAINLTAVFLINRIMKYIFRRPRPEVLKLAEETGFSFPSAHAMVSMGYYGFFIYLSYKYIKNKKLKIASILVLSILIFLIGISRIYLGVHYATDIICGFIFGVIYLYIFTQKIKWKKV